MTLNLFDTLISLVRSVPEPELRYSFFLKLICNFNLYYTSNFAIHDRLLIEIKTFLMEDEIFQRFKANCEITYLFHSLETYYNLEMAVDFFSSKGSRNDQLERHDSLNCLIIQKHIVHFTDLLQIRNEILDIIASIIVIMKSEEILKKEISLILQSLSKKNMVPSSMDYLLLLKKVLIKHLGKSTAIFNAFPFEETLLNMLKILKDNNFKIQSVKEVNDVENYNKMQTLDEFLAELLELQLIFVWEKKDPHCKMLKALDYLLPKNLNNLTVHLLFEASKKFKSMPAHFKLIEILFKRLEFIQNDKVFEILQYVKNEMRESEEVLKYFSRKKILRFYTKSLNLADKIALVPLMEINDLLIEHLIESKANSSILFHEYIAYNQGIFLYKMIQILNKSLQKNLADKNLNTFYEKKEKITSIINFLQFFMILEETLPILFKSHFDFKPIFDCLNNFYEFFKTIKLLYLTLPEIVSFNNINIDIKELWSSICEISQEFYFKNGGILFTFCHILFKIMDFLLENKLFEETGFVFALIRKIFLLEKEISSKSFIGKIKESTHPMKAYIEESNSRFSKYIMKQIENFNEKACFLHLGKKGENKEKSFEIAKSSENREIEIFHYLFYRLLKLLTFQGNTQIKEEICGLLVRVFRINGQEFISFLKNIKPFNQSLVLKKSDSKKQFDKENFMRICMELNENNQSFAIKKSNLLKEEDNLTKDIENITDFFNKFIEFDKINNDIIEKIQDEVFPKAKAFFKKSVYLVLSLIIKSI